MGIKERRIISKIRFVTLGLWFVSYGQLWSMGFECADWSLSLWAIQEAQRRMGAVRQLFEEPSPPKELPSQPFDGSDTPSWSLGPSDVEEVSDGKLHATLSWHIQGR